MNTRWLIPLPAILFAVFPQHAKAEPQPGLEYTIYDNYTGQGNGYNASPPIPPTTPIIGTGVADNIYFQWGGGNILGTNISEDVVVKFEGFIKPPTNQTYYFCGASDDGFKLILDGETVIDDWFDRGGGCGQTADVDFGDGQSKQLTAWYYENGGGAFVNLLYYTGNGWLTVPASWFTQQAVATTTTTVSSTTTSTTTTEPSTTTTSTTTTLPTTTTTTTEPIQTSTTTSVADTTTTTTTTTSTTVPQTTTTTEAPYTPPQTTTTTPTIEPQPQPTTTEPATTTTEPETSTTVPDETLPEPVEPDVTTIPETTVPAAKVQPVPVETEQPTDTTEPQEYTTETTLLEETDSSTTTLPETVIEIPADEPVTDEQLEQILDTLTEAAPEQIVAAVTQLLNTDITSDQATEIASNPEVLAAITSDQAEQLFEEIVVEQLTEEQLAQFTETIQQAPTKVKKAFEKTINIFGSQFENYVPTGSNIPVKTRRTLVAAGALIATIPSTRVRR